MRESWSRPLVSLVDMCPLHPTVMVSGTSQPPLPLGPVQVLLHRRKSAAGGIPLVQIPAHRMVLSSACPGPYLTMTSEPWVAPLHREQSGARTLRPGPRGAGQLCSRNVEATGH